MESIYYKFSNALYKEWLKTHDPYDDDFLELLASIAPSIEFGYSTDHSEIIVLTAFHNI